MDYREHKSFELNIAYCKVLETVHFLNNLNYFPNAHGIGKILNGVIDAETEELKNCPTFGSFISVGGRKCCAMVTQLVRHELLKYFYEEKVDDLFLRISSKISLIIFVLVM